MNSVEQLLKHKIAVRLDEEKKRAAAMFWESATDLAEYTDPTAAHKDLHATALKHGYKHAGTSPAYPHGTDSSRMRVVHDYQHPSGHTLEVHSDQNGSHASYFHNTSGDYGRSKTALNNHLKAIHAPKK